MSIIPKAVPVVLTVRVDHKAIMQLVPVDAHNLEYLQQEVES
jgi:hypothetical protein